jgi:hypothetical protein
VEFGKSKPQGHRAFIENSLNDSILFRWTPNSDVEKLLITAPRGEKEMSDKDRGLLILAVGNLRKWAAGLRTGDRAVSFVSLMKVGS